MMLDGEEVIVCICFLHTLSYRKEKNAGIISEVRVQYRRAILSYGKFKPASTHPFVFSGSYHKRQKPHAPTPQAPIRNRQTRKVANAKGLNRKTNLAAT